MSPTGGAIVGVTVVSFTALSPSGTSYQWNFGDGNTGSGQSVNHVYSAINNFTVSLTTGSGATGTGDIAVQSLTGTWADVEDPTILQWSLVQSGPGLSGTNVLTNATVQGTISSPRHVVIHDGSLVLTGRVEDGLNAMDVTWTGPAGPQEARLIRQ
jgi:PKD repeat protein